jgi:hypothetical protein
VDEVGRLADAGRLPDQVGMQRPSLRKGFHPDCPERARIIEG